MSLNVICLDPSLTCTGIALVNLERPRVLAWRTVRTAPPPKAAGGKTLATGERVADLAEGIRAFYGEYGPAPFAIEAQVGASFPGQGGKGASMANVGKLMLAYGACLAAVPTRPLLVLPSEVKRRLGVTKLAGEAATGKVRVREVCRARVAGAHPPEPEDGKPLEAVWDAVAVGFAVEPEVRRLAAMAGDVSAIRLVPLADTPENRRRHPEAFLETPLPRTCSHGVPLGASCDPCTDAALEAEAEAPDA